MTPSGAQQIKIFLPTPSARRATVVFSFTQTADNISTHALREEGDAEAVGITVSAIFISTHALREEGDCVRKWRTRSKKIFLPTPSARRATASPSPRRSRRSDFYPRPPRGGRQRQAAGKGPLPQISTHALREEGDPGVPEMGCRRKRISTHALREEGDPRLILLYTTSKYFYPRPPRGGRPDLYLDDEGELQFLPTPSARRATGPYPDIPAVCADFYPRPPRGGRPAAVQRAGAGQAISTHALREEGDLKHDEYNGRQQDFYPRPPRGGRRRQPTVPAHGQWIFLPTPSARRATGPLRGL